MQLTGQRNWHSPGLNHLYRVCLHKFPADRCCIMAGRQGRISGAGFPPSSADWISVLSATGRHAPSYFVRTNADARAKSSGDDAVLRKKCFGCLLTGRFCLELLFSRHEEGDGAPPPFQVDFYCTEILLPSPYPCARWQTGAGRPAAGRQGHTRHQSAGLRQG